MILDQYGQIINMDELRTPQSGSLTHIPNRMDDHPAHGLTPGKLHRILTGAETGTLATQVQLFRDIEDRDAHIFGDFQKRRRRVLTRSWDVIAPEDATPDEQRAADFVRAWLRGLSDIEDIFYDMAEAIGFGYSCFELQWGGLDGVPVPVKFHWRPQEWLQLRPVNDAKPLTALSGTRNDLRLADGSSDGAQLWPGGWLIHVHKAKSGYLDRSGLFRVIAWMYLLKHYALTDLPRFLEIYGVPPRIGKYDPATITPKDKSVLYNAVRNLGQDMGGIMPHTMSIDLLQAASGNTDAFISVARMCDDYSSKAILGRDVVASGGLNGGAGQNEANNADVAEDLNIADCKQIAQSFTQDVIWPIVSWFGISDPRRCPRLRFDTSAPADVVKVAGGIKAAQDAGLKIGRDWAYERMQIPVPADDEVLLEPPAAAAPANPFGAFMSARPTQAAQLSATPGAARTDRDELDDMVDVMLDGWQPVMNDVLAPLRDAVQQAAENGESLKDLQARIPQLLDGISIDALTEQIAKGQYLAQLAGRAGVLDPDLPKKR